MLMCGPFLIYKKTDVWIVDTKTTTEGPENFLLSCRYKTDFDIWEIFWFVLVSFSL